MSHTLEIEKPDEIRCSYCLSWNQKQASICTECTTALYDSVNFGAARALFSWERTDPNQLKYSFSAEKRDRIDLWNNTFQTQFSFFQKEFHLYNFLSKYAILDIQEEVAKYFLSTLPMRPELFKEFKEYEFPENSKNEIELLNFMFRTHPASIFKALAGLALVQLGRADVKILQYLNAWDGHYKKLKREKLLGFAHWSVQKLNFFSQYSAYVNEIMPLSSQENSAASWAKIFLYKADYDIQELKFSLEEIIASEKTHIAISACFALRKYDKIKDLLLDELDESTIELAFKYSDEKHIPNLLRFLKHAPRKHHEAIIRRCVQLDPNDERTKNQIVEWLLEQSDVVLLEVLFSWRTIPRLEEVIQKMQKEANGIQALSSFLPTWMRDNEVRFSENESLRLLCEYENKQLDSTAEKTLQKLQTKLQEIDFELLCADIRKKAGENQLKELFNQLFATETKLSERQISEGFQSLTRATENTKATEKPYFRFENGFGMNTLLSEPDFHFVLGEFLKNKDYQRPVSNWLFALYDLFISNKTEHVFDSEIFRKHVDFAFQEILAQRMDVGTSCRFLKLLFKQKATFPLDDLHQKQLNNISCISNDFETKYWIEQVLGLEK